MKPTLGVFTPLFYHDGSSIKHGKGSLWQLEYTAAGKRIMMKAILIEPSKLYREMVGHILAEHDFEVAAFDAGGPAIAAIAQDKFDIVCTSLYLPDMQGQEFCMRLRAEESTRLKPILMLTTEDNLTQIQSAMMAGATEIFAKNKLNHLSVFLEEFCKRNKRKKKQHGHILYIEDNMVVAAATRAQLMQIGYKVDLCRSAEAAFEMFLKGKYDLVITDIILEGRMTGFSLVRELRKLPDRYGEVPILAVSSFSDPQRKIEILNAGASDYLTKPTLDEELAVRVANLITNRQLLDKVQRQQQQLHELAMRDQLTTLYNRHYLMDIGPKALRQASRQKYALCMMIVDLDHFKVINDTHGHTTGDFVLSRVAKLLRRNSREEDIAARFGGEEFVVLLPYCNETDAIRKAEVIRREIEQMKPNDILVTASFGIAPLPTGNHTSFEMLFEAADQAVYRAKENGRNRIEVQTVNAK
jgi:two-component system, cell cycle response regulator